MSMVLDKVGFIENLPEKIVCDGRAVALLHT
jgi:hypothetical protein